ncbi:hypothetical protein [Candidatus Leptofilum sp.]|uniref:hypothetical protein n=1 Tax=Candidatus Leptofilum sp. TaxID=3241576 RepID=UPI003B5B6F57
MNFESCDLSPNNATYLAWFEVGVAAGWVASDETAVQTHLTLVTLYQKVMFPTCAP